MGMKSKSTSTEEKLPTGTRDFREPANEIASGKSAVSQAPSTDSGTAAAVSRLKAKTEAVIEAADKLATDKGVKDYRAQNEETARGKTRCQTYCAALMSPALAGMKWEKPEDLMKILRSFADDGLAYSFNDPKSSDPK